MQVIEKQQTDQQREKANQIKTGKVVMQVVAKSCGISEIWITENGLYVDDKKWMKDFVLESIDFICHVLDKKVYYVNLVRSGRYYFPHTTSAADIIDYIRKEQERVKECPENCFVGEKFL